MTVSGVAASLWWGPPCKLRLQSASGGQGLKQCKFRSERMFPDQPAQTEPFVQFPNQDEAAIGSPPVILEKVRGKRVERELKGLILPLTDWVSTS
jgi:hypothetical protein